MMKQLQRLGKALMQPVAVLPAAALLMGIGYALDPTGWGGNSALAAFFIKAGAAILDNLGILFAIGVSYGLSKDKDGASALAGLVGFLTVTFLLSEGAVMQLKKVTELSKETGFFKINNGNVFIGILIGVIAAWIYNRFYQTKLPAALSFFAGRRLVPILTAFASIAVSGVLFFVWPVIFTALVAFGTKFSSLGALGAGLYGFLNRLLIPTGLHHALNQVFWFNIADINDIGNYWNLKTVAEVAAVESAKVGYTVGMYQAGFFPVMMFGLPAAALAMYNTAKPAQKKVAFGLLSAAAFTSFLTGVTEPLEFAFMFLSPVLYFIHALLTGISVYISALFKWTSGFGFSAGCIDYVLGYNNPAAKQPYMLLVQGLVFAIIYYIIFRVLIVSLNLKTPGREDEVSADEGQVLDSNTNFAQMAATILAGLGGKENIEDVDYCITRLRVNVKDHLAVDEKKIKSAGISGIIRPSKANVQVIVGPQVQFVKDALDTLM